MAEAKVLESFTAIEKAPMGTRCYDSAWRTVRRVHGGWVYEGSPAPGLFQDYEMTKYAPLTVIEQVQPEVSPPIPRVPSRVIGRVYWTAHNPSPWVSFSGISSYRFWAADTRRYLPGVKVEMAYLDHIHTAASLMSVAEFKSPLPERPERPEGPEGGGIGIRTVL